MSNKKLRIVSRESPLAVWQAEHVRECLLARHPDCSVEIISVKTTADRFPDKTLGSIGGKGMFIKELEQALLTGRADIAVHSMKDVTIDLPEQLALPVIMQREDPTDVFIANHFVTLADLPAGARVGTSSLRRQCQLKAWRADLQLVDVRGNVGTRLAKLDAGDYDALILAAAGIKRLGMQQRIRERISTDTMLPAVGQGALGIEIRADDNDTLQRVSVLQDPDTRLCVTAERMVSRHLFGSCHLPLAVFASCDADSIAIRALVGRPDGSTILRADVRGSKSQAQQLAQQLADTLLAQGADAILRELQTDADQ
ncbi:MAG: hydroxymethylbilane synthase [Gammaproteobacteria bacterium]